MEICCYILYSQTLAKYYTGACQSDLQARINKHTSAVYGKTHYTATAKDWTLALRIDTESYAHAIRLERKIKSMKSSKFIENLMRYPELLAKIYNETK